ncbi:unnamed protein product [Rotaria sp. Silwood2]|nr:unnamed protein product [Rotaria sp. Silwood2]CAF4310375.1 unnamed protein product [Rotaria sp. Silwood2]CAF4378823.1 unnamed protein product [Rotaria sp. Silwood2]
MVDVLYSLVDVTRWFDQLVLDSVYIRNLDMISMTMKSFYDRIYSIDNQILDRICKSILPRIHHQVCAQLPALTKCRLPFNFCSDTRNKLPKYSTVSPLMTLPNIFNTTHIRTLTIDISISHFLENLLVCVPFIENLSVGVKDSKMYENDILTSCQMSVSGVKLFPQANELLIHETEREVFLSDISNCKSSILLCVSWSSLTKISIENFQTISEVQLAPILQLACNLHTLEITDESDTLPHALLHNEDNLGTIVN